MSQFHVMADAHEHVEPVAINRIALTDITAALRAGIDDFWARPSHYVFLALIYPLAGIVIAMLAAGQNALPLLYPLMSGFALLGPITAIGLYEISRRREQGLDTAWHHAFDVRHSPALFSILALGLMLMVVFILWLYTAQTLYQSLFGEFAATSIPTVFEQVFTTQEGRTLLIVGNLVGFCFALMVLMTTVIAFPLLLDRDVGLIAAISASIRAMVKNPIEMLAWGALVAVALLLGTLPFFVGLALVVPVLGHATWHLYRRLTA